MAGRGTRVGGYGERDVPLRRPGEAAVPSANAEEISIASLTAKICSITVTNVDPVLLNETETLFIKLCPNTDALNDVLEQLHSKALGDSDFGEKLAVALEQLIEMEFQVDSIPLKRSIFQILQNDFEVKDSVYKSDRKKYLNAVNLLGSFYNYLKAGGKPVTIVGCALLDYFETLLQGSEEEIKVVAKQVLFNGKNLLETKDRLNEKYEAMRKSLRKRLIDNDLSSKSRCWILLCLDYMSNNLSPVQEDVRSFYLEVLGDEFSKLEPLAKSPDPSKSGNPMLFSGTVEAFKPGGLSEFAKNHLTGHKKSASGIKKNVKNKDIVNDFSNMSVSDDRHFNNKDFKGEGRQAREKKGPSNWRKNEDKVRNMKETDKKISQSAKESASSLNDDDFYGIQLPKEKIKGLHKKTESPAVEPDSSSTTEKKSTVGKESGEQWD
ncbi:UNVERIFIED_CONTAM: hypothetical protein PYX00_010239 [Menopon gallinae]|uniref:Uncharacterized protein n=1 Tax=Menopon gallinae TaxID=328185 RepID=A0AAW2HF21_9NEOP